MRGSTRCRCSSATAGAASGCARLGRATPREMGALRDSILRLPDVAGALSAVEGDLVFPALDLLTDIGEELGRALVERPPAQLDDGDTIKAGYDRDLDDLKAARDGGKQYIAALQARERERTGISSLKVGFNKVFGYYIEVTHAHRERIPADYERRQTLTGAERYVTPDLKEYEAKVLGAEERIAAREREVLDQLRRRVGEAIARVQASAARLAQLDAWAALAVHPQRRDAGRRRPRGAADRPQHGGQVDVAAAGRALRRARADRLVCPLPPRTHRRRGPPVHARRRLGQSGTRPVDVHGRDERDERDPARRHRPQPRAARRDWARHVDLRRCGHRVGGHRVPAQHHRLQDDFRDALP